MQPQTRRTITPQEVRSIARDAYIYGFPLVDNYRIQYSYFIDKNSPEYKGPWNQVLHDGYASQDTKNRIPTPDMHYSFVGADLRAEPLVIGVPKIEEPHHYSIQLIDMYTFSFASIGSRANGNAAASFLLAGPNFKGSKPTTIREVIKCETQFAFLRFGTTLPVLPDVENVTQIQTGFQVETLSQFLGKRAPSVTPEINFLTPLTTEEEKSELEFFIELNFILHFCPTHPSEKDLMAQFAKLGIGVGQVFNPKKLSTQMRKAIEAGISDAWEELETKQAELSEEKTEISTRESLRNNYMHRMLLQYRRRTNSIR